MSSSPNLRLPSSLFSLFSAPQISAGEVWAALRSYMEEIGIIKSKYTLTPGIGQSRAYRLKYLDRKLTPQEIAGEFARADDGGFTIYHSLPREVISLQHFSFRHISRQREGFQQLAFMMGAKEGLLLDWSPLVDRLVGLGNLAWLGISCHPYLVWQNCSIPENYEEQYGGIANFETYELNGQRTLNVLRNPGSNHVHGGVLVRANSEMWLGPSFWDFAPCTKDEVLAADFFIEKRETPHYLYIKSWPHPFTRPDGEQGRVQQKLWRLLYKQDCEWPPGSGTICDEPMYGPKELWPSGSEYPYGIDQKS